MPSAAVASVGGSLKRGNGASVEVFTAFAEVTGINPSGQTMEMIDVTTLGSTGGYREFMASFIDPGEVAVEGNFTHDNYATLLADQVGKSLVNYQITIDDPDSSVISFSAYTTSIQGPVLSTADAVKCSFTLKITGAVTQNT